MFARAIQKAKNVVLCENLQKETLPLTDENEIILEKKVKGFILGVRGLFRENPSLAEQMQAEILCDDSASDIPLRCQLLKSLIRMYQSPDSRYLNFYGPPGTIPTISYCQVLDQLENPGSRRTPVDFKGKAVFIGHSERVLPNFKDGFYTAFSHPSGVDISGVEMTATAFANLLEDRPI